MTLKGNANYGSIFMVNFMIFKTQTTDKIKAIFDGTKDTLVWSCLNGTMGEIYTDEEEKSASAVIGDFCFLAGEPCRELIENAICDYVIMVPQDEKWSELIVENFGEKARKFTRYATKKELTFDIQSLECAKLPDGFEMKFIDNKIFDYCKNTYWCSDFVSQYKDFETYEELGLGVAVLKDDVLVSGASSYSAYKGGIEIQVDTKSGYRRQGLAYFACAKLILKCLEKGIFPSWDAHNLTSLALAQKLGYQFSHSYTAYEIKRNTDA